MIVFNASRMTRRMQAQFKATIGFVSELAICPCAYEICRPAQAVRMFQSPDRQAWVSLNSIGSNKPSENTSADLTLCVH